ncbi:MAG TPA: TonB-dependent receptor [Candidatus Coprenecus pullistercoris]|nr:TonB-dependent receptor [Candidatus Coprenecus pullistercoris]
MSKRFLKAVFSILIASASLHCGNLYAQTIRGVVRDAATSETLPGVVIMFERIQDGAGSGMTGVQTEVDGSYTITIPEGAEGVLGLYLIGYNDLKSEVIILKKGEERTMDFSMELQSEVLEGVTVIARKDPGSTGALINDRKVSAQAVENIGASEIRIKGLSNVEEAVETMSGVSFNNSGQLFVRGLGDRYSLTTLNGLPVASPNPDNKLIPLDIFSSSVLQDITVTKVYTATSFADYSGAHIDISTKENVGDSFLSISLGFNGIIGTTFKDTYRPDRKGWLLHDNNIPGNVRNMSLSDFRTYIVNNDPFGTTFDISKSMAIPDISGSVSGGRTFQLRNGDELSLLASASISSGSQNIYDAYITNINTQGQHMDEFHYNGYEHSLDLTGLLSLNYLFKNGDKIGFTMLYAKNAMEDYKLREGYDAEDNQLLGSNSIAHSYSLWNNQLGGSHTLHPKWNIDWKVSYGMTDSNEPDRRQVMYRRGQDGSLSLFKLNRQETMRYYGELAEQEVVAEIKPTFSFGDNNSKLIFGAAYKDKTRDYNSLRFYYNLSDINPVISDIYTPSSFINQQSIADGLIKIERDAQPKNNYYAGHRILAGFAEVEYYPVDQLLLSLGVRYEYSQQWVRYWNDASRENVSRLDKGDFFPALNIKYTLNNRHNFRFASSITVTRPSFIEMAPFLYKESYGSAEIRGNDQLTNGYNYNFDLKYEYFSTNNKHMFSVGAYYKILKDPIERVQETSGGAIVHTFRNAQQGMAAGLKAEFRTTPFRYFTIGGNISLMYTDVTLLDGGIYTDSRRALQGASPYVGNAFITYAPEFGEESSLAISVLYNVQGPRIQAVGIYGLGNIMQAPIHTIDANITYQINRLWSIQLSMTNLLDSEYRFSQNVPDLGKDMLTESYRLGRGIGIGVKLDF